MLSLFLIGVWTHGDASCVLMAFRTDDQRLSTFMAVFENCEIIDISMGFYGLSFHSAGFHSLACNFQLWRGRISIVGYTRSDRKLLSELAKKFAGIGGYEGSIDSEKLHLIEEELYTKNPDQYEDILSYYKKLSWGTC